MNSRFQQFRSPQSYHETLSSDVRLSCDVRFCAGKIAYEKHEGIIYVLNDIWTSYLQAFKFVTYYTFGMKLYGEQNSTNGLNGTENKCKDEYLKK